VDEEEWTVFDIPGTMAEVSESDSGGDDDNGDDDAVAWTSPVLRETACCLIPA